MAMMNLFEKWSAGLSYANFLGKYASPSDNARWLYALNQTVLTPEQHKLLSSFKRRMPVLCLAGAWCGDCAGQCPIFERFAEVARCIETRYIDRDDHPDVQKVLRINGGDRVPVVVFFSEDGYEVARYGERTLSQYRHLAEFTHGAACPTGLNPSADPVPARIVQDWLDEFERVQLILRLSPRLRQIHDD
jgi:thiol-disulfide isomerase/thioredoxin